MRTRVKICGITTFADAEMALDAGADALGFVFEPSSPRFVGDDPELIKSIQRLRPFTTLVAVFGVQSRGIEIDEFDAVQFLERLEDGVGPGVKIIQALRPTKIEDLDAELETARDASAILIDGFHSSAFGGSGVRADWNIARTAVERSEVNAVLAGGLTPDNVEEAIRFVRPYGVDVSSGVESSLRLKDSGLVRAFIEAAKRA